MKYRKSTAAVLIVVFQQFGSSAYSQEVSTGDAGIDAAIENTGTLAKKKIIAEVAATAIEEFAEGAVKKYGPTVARKAVGGPVGLGLGIFFASSPADEGSDIVPNRPLAREIPTNELERRLGNQNLNLADFSSNRELRSPGALDQAEADLRRELLRREAAAAARSGGSYIPDPRLLREIDNFDGFASSEREKSRFSPNETALQASLAGQTTGITSSIGDARPSTSPDPELERILATDPRSPFTTSVETPGGQSSGAFTGEEGLNIAGVLNVLAFDSGSLQDGDRVRLTVRDSRGTILSRTITLTFGGTRSTVSARRGIVNVTITALNEGSSPPNTGGLRVSGDVYGSRSGNFNLSRGRSGTLAVRVLGN